MLSPGTLQKIRSSNRCPPGNQHAIRRIVRPMPGSKSFRCARILIAGIALMHMIRKGQLDCAEGQVSPAASRFYSRVFWAAGGRRPPGLTGLRRTAATEPDFLQPPIAAQALQPSPVPHAARSPVRWFAGIARVWWVPFPCRFHRAASSRPRSAGWRAPGGSADPRGRAG